MEDIQKYKIIFELSPEGILLIDRKGNVIDANTKMCEWLGYKKEEFVGKSIKDQPYLSKENRARAMEIFAKRVDGKEVLPYEIDFIAKSGDIRAGRVIASLLKDESGKTIGEFAMVSDITEEKKAGEAIRASEARYRLITENTSDFIVVIKFDGTYTYVSPSHRQLGYEPDDLVGKSGFDMIAPEDKKRLLPLVGKYAQAVVIGAIKGAAKDFVEHIEFRFHDKWGTWHIMQATANLIESQSGKGYDILMVYRDVTRQKEAEQNLEKQKQLLDSINRELKQKVEKLEDAMGHIKRLEGLVPICSNCKKIRLENEDPADPASWTALEDYIEERTDAGVTHGLCPECARKLYGKHYKGKDK
jgi:PAS domain S-box-containing protein